MYAYKRKTALFAHSGRQDAFAIDMAGTSPTAEWVCGRLRAIMKAVFPSAVHGLDYTDHCLRRGGATCLCFMNIDPAIQEHAGGFSRNSASRPAYVAMVRQTLANAQARMHEQEYDIIQDDVGWTLKSAQPRTATPACPQSEQQRQRLATSIDGAMDIDTLDEDELITQTTGRDAGVLTDSEEDEPYKRLVFSMINQHSLTQTAHVYSKKIGSFNE